MTTVMDIAHTRKEDWMETRKCGMCGKCRHGCCKTAVFESRIVPRHLLPLCYLCYHKYVNTQRKMAMRSRRHEGERFRESGGEKEMTVRDVSNKKGDRRLFMRSLCLQRAQTAENAMNEAKTKMQHYAERHGVHVVSRKGRPGEEELWREKYALFFVRGSVRRSHLHHNCAMCSMLVKLEGDWASYNSAKIRWLKTAKLYEVKVNK